MPILLHDEHLDLDGNRIHISSEQEGDFEVWLNTDVGDFDGLCIGCGPTREQAVRDAAIVLEQASRALRQSNQQPHSPAGGVIDGND